MIRIQIWANVCSSLVVILLGKGNDFIAGELICNRQELGQNMWYHGYRKPGELVGA